MYDSSMCFIELFFNKCFLVEIMNRHPRSFNTILNFYRTGKLHVADEMCALAFKLVLMILYLPLIYMDSCSFNSLQVYLFWGFLMCLKRKHPWLPFSCPQVRLGLLGNWWGLHWVMLCVSLLFFLLFFTLYNIMKSKENLFEPKREKHVTKREGVMEAMEQTRWTFLVFRGYFFNTSKKGDGHFCSFKGNCWD